MSLTFAVGICTRTFSRRNFSGQDRVGLTLVEILVGLVMTVIVLGVMIYAFRFTSQEIASGRAVMELSNQLRTAKDLIRSDLDGATVDARPWTKSASPPGYIELIEGARNDLSSLDGNGDGTPDIIDGDGDGLPDGPTPLQAIMGDVDDILCLTVRSQGRPFRGRFNGEIIESNVAEVIWWTSFQDTVDPVTGAPNGIADYDEPVTLHRRVLLVRPDLIATLAATPNPLQIPDPVAAPDGMQEFFLLNDISARPASVNGTWSMVPNSLEDLAKRENRFGRVGLQIGGTYPYPLVASLDVDGNGNGDIGLIPTTMSLANFADIDASQGTLGTHPDLPEQAGDDIVLSDVIGFDLQVWSERTPIEVRDGVASQPGDPGYTGDPANQVDTGAFVDPGYLGAVAFDETLPEFSTLPHPRSGFVQRVFDTFSTHYESNGVDDDGSGLIDQGINGIDDDSANGVDDNLERETVPPYPFDLSGIKIRIRVVEPKSKQVRQTEIVERLHSR